MPSSEPTFMLEVVAHPDAPPALQEYALAYWTMDGVDTAGDPRWQHRQVSALPVPTGWSARPNLLAAVGASAEVRGESCPSCGTTPFRPTSRSSYLDLLRGRPSTSCMACSVTVRDEVTRLRDPKLIAERARIAEQQAERAQVSRDRELAQARLYDARRHAIREQFPLQTWPMPAISIRQRIELESVLQLADEHGVGPFHEVDPVLVADRRDSAGVLGDLAGADLLRIAPDSEVDAFVWDSDSATLTDRYFAAQAIYQLPGTGHYDDRLGQVRASLPLLARESLTDEERREVRDMAADALVDEATRYLDLQLRVVGLAQFEQRHWESLRAAVRPRLGTLTLGQLYAMGLSATNSALHTAREHHLQHDRVPQRAVNKLAEYVDDAVAGRKAFKTYQQDRRQAIARSTSILFRSLLRLDPLTTGMDEVTEALDLPIGECPAPTPWRTTYDRLLAEGVDPARFDAAVDRLSRQPQGVDCDGRCHHRNIQEAALDAVVFSRSLTDSGITPSTRIDLTMQALAFADAVDPVGSATLEAIAFDLLMPDLRDVE